MPNKETIIEKVDKYPKIIDMTVDEYRDFYKDKDLPCVRTIYNYFDKWYKFKQEVFSENIGSRWWDEKSVIKALEKYPMIAEMTSQNYRKFKEDKTLPSRATIQRYLGGWNKMKNKVYGKDAVIGRKSIPDYCNICLEKTDCDYNFDLEKCKYY